MVAVQREARRAQLRLVPHRRHGEADVRVAGQQRLAALGMAAGHRPGVAALELRQAGVDQRLLAEAGQPVEVLPVAGGQGRCLDHPVRVPVEVEDLQVVAAELVAHVAQHRLGAERGGEAVGHVAGHADGVLDGERAFVDAQQVEFHRRRAAVLVLVDAVEVGLQRLHGRRLGIEGLGEAVGVLADAQGAEQPVGVDQLGAEHLGQFAARQAAQHLHLEQAILGVHVAERAVHIRFVLRLDVRHAALVVAHADRRLQVGEGQFAAALRLLAVHVPGGAGGHRRNDDGEGGQGALHRRKTPFRSC
ncbi:hypothetical protein D9M69_273150 [compost metagenome]